MENFTQWDVATYFGLSAAVVGAIGALKKLFPTWIEGKEPHIGLVLSYVIGVSTKLFMPGAYEKVHWVPFLLSLLLVAAGAKFGHDYLVNKVIANKPSPEEQIKTMGAKVDVVVDNLAPEAKKNVETEIRKLEEKKG
jgi:hypothetical protein